MQVQKRLNSAETALALGVFESQLTELAEKGLLPRWSAGYSESAVAECKLKMKGVKLSAPDEHALLNMSEAMKVSGFSRAELIEFGHSGKLSCRKHANGWRFTRAGIDQFKAKLKLAGI